MKKVKLISRRYWVNFRKAGHFHQRSKILYVLKGSTFCKPGHCHQRRLKLLYVLKGFTSVNLDIGMKKGQPFIRLTGLTSVNLDIFIKERKYYTSLKGLLFVNLDIVMKD